MNPLRTKVLAGALCAGFLMSCAKEAATPNATDTGSPTVTPISNPSDSGSSSPNWTISPGGRLYLSWQQRLADSSLVLKYVTREANDSAWSPIQTVNTGTNMVLSAGDPPQIREQSNGSLVAVWRGGHGQSGYDVMTSRSVDSGSTWSPAKSPHSDVTPTEHGFVSWLQLGDTAAMVWLDGRLNAEKDTLARRTQLALASLSVKGDVNATTMIEPKICDCCHTASAVLPGGAAVVYRDRDDGEIRDISVMRLASDGWRKPVRVHNDNWRINGCPVNGPSISARGGDVVVAWFTAASDTARVRVAFSSDTATTFSSPIEVNESFPDGKVGVVLTSTGAAIVSWIERKGTMAVLRIRTISKDGTKSPVSDVGQLGEGKRAGGAPKLVQHGDNVLLAWSNPQTGKISTASIRIPSPAQ